VQITIDGINGDQENYRLLTENSNDLIARLSIDGVCRYVSPACESLLGYTPAELIGRNAFELIHPMDKRAVASMIEPEILFQLRQKTVCRLRRKDGFYGWFEITASFFSDVDTKSLQVVVIVRDIVERIKAERFEHVRHALIELRASDASPDAELPALLETVCTTLQWEMGQIWLASSPNDAEITLRRQASWHISSPSLEELDKVSASMILAPGFGLAGVVWSKGEVHIFDSLDSVHSLLLRQHYQNARIRSAIGAPIMGGSQVYGVAIFLSRRQIQHNTGLIDMIAGLGYEVGQYLAKQHALQDEMTRQRQLAHDIAFAAQVQQSLLPEADPSLKAFQLASAALPARSISGDFYDFVLQDPTILDVLIADVSGKGFPSALMTSSARTLFRHGTEAGKNPSTQLRGINKALYEDCRRTSMFLTAQLLRLDLDFGTVTYASCGHTEALVWKHLEDRVVRIGSTAIPIGIIEDIDIGELAFALLPGDFILLYSDGVTEATNSSGELFGTERLVQHFERLVTQLTDAQNVASALVNEVRTFSGSQILSDDLTLLALKALTRSYTLTVPASIESLDKAASFVRKPVSFCGKQLADEIELIASELFTNIVVHGFAKLTTSGEMPMIDIGVRIEAEKVVLDFFYEDEAFNPLLKPDVLPDPLAESGRGIYIVKSLSDVFQYMRGEAATTLRNAWNFAGTTPNPTQLNNLHIEKYLPKRVRFDIQEQSDSHGPCDSSNSSGQCEPRKGINGEAL
jgi:PAS domain S-box-containing protein